MGATDDRFWSGGRTGRRVPVRDLSRFGRVWEVSVDDGTATLGHEGAVWHGLCLPYPRPISALYVDGDQMWLQVGGRRWNVDEILEVRQVSETPIRARYRLVFRDGRTERVAIRFPAGVVIHRMIDPTHDELDSWSEDIMKMFPYIRRNSGKSDSTEDVATWKARVFPDWRAGRTFP